MELGVRAAEIVKDGVVPSVTGDSGNAAMEVVLPSVVDETMAKEKQSPLVNTTSLGSYPPLPTQEATSASNAPGKSSYANVTEKTKWDESEFSYFVYTGGKRVACPVIANYVRNTWGKYRLVRSMFSSSTGLFSFQFKFMEGLNVMLENGPWFIPNNPLILKKWHLDVNLLKEDVGIVPLRADVELKDNIVATMPKITREGYYTCNIRVEYKWKPPRCACYKVFGHVQEECPKNIGTGETKNLKKTSQTLKGILVVQKMGLKPTKQVFQPISKKPSANTSVSTNEGTSNLASQATNPSKSSFWNVDASSLSTTPILEKIDKIEKLIIDGKVTLVDEEGKPLEKVASLCDYDSEDESLLEQWMESYENDNYGYDPYDDDMYEGQDIPDNLQAICDQLDITVKGRRKK
ncbi:putative reverse transcriptase domain-containing protein [Tanacetum coccineum]